MKSLERRLKRKLFKAGQMSDHTIVSSEVMKLSKQELEKLYWSEQKSLEEIAKLMGCSISYIRYLMVKRNISRRLGGSYFRSEEYKRKLSEIQTKYHFSADELRQLYWEKGLSLAEIACFLHVDTTTIYRQFVKYSIPRKKSKDYPHYKPPNKRVQKTCPVCGKVFYVKTSYALRIKRPHCSNICKYNDPILREKIRATLSKIPLSKEELTRLYLDKPAYQIAIQYGISGVTVLKWLRKYGIPIKSSGDWRRGKSMPLEVRMKISLAHKGKIVSEETRKKFSQVRKGMTPWNKGKPFMRGESHPLFGKHPSKKTRQKIRLARMKQRFPSFNTAPEIKFIEMCKKYSLPFKYVGNGSFWIENFNPDFIDVNGEKTAVDIFGDYWHNPKLRRNLPIYQRESNRKAIFQKYGWNLIVLWEHELENEMEVLEKIGKN